METLLRMVKFSICIPVYNMERTIARCLQSALNQRHGDFEILLLDNQSTDRTLEIALSFQDPRLRVQQNSTNLGAYGNHNECLRLARGKWVKFLHGDDELLPDCLAVFDRVLKACPSEVALLSCGAIQYDQSDRESSRTYLPDELLMIRPALLDEFILAGNIVGTPTMSLLHRERLLAMGGFDCAMEPGSDGDCWLMMRQHYATAFVPEYLIIARDDPPSVLSKRAAHCCKCIECSIRQVKKWYSRHPESNSKRTRELYLKQWLVPDLFRFWRSAVKFALVGQPQVMLCLWQGLSQFGLCWWALRYFIGRQLRLFLKKNEPGEVLWPVRLAHLRLAAKSVPKA